MTSLLWTAATLPLNLYKTGVTCGYALLVLLLDMAARIVKSSCFHAGGVMVPIHLIGQTWSDFPHDQSWDCKTENEDTNHLHHQISQKVLCVFHTGAVKRSSSLSPQEWCFECGWYKSATKMLYYLWLPVFKSRYAFHCVVHMYLYVYLYISKCIVWHMKTTIWDKLHIVKSVTLMFNFGFHLVWHPVEGELPVLMLCCR